MRRGLLGNRCSIHPELRGQCDVMPCQFSIDVRMTKNLLGKTQTVKVGAKRLAPAVCLPPFAKSAKDGGTHCWVARARIKTRNERRASYLFGRLSLHRRHFRRT